MCFLCGTNLLNPKYGLNITELTGESSSFVAEEFTGSKTTPLEANPNFNVVDEAITSPYLAGLLTAVPFGVTTPVGWNTSDPVKYYFDDTGTRAWSATEKQAMLNGFASWSAVANIDFVETTDRSQADLINVLDNSTQSLGSVTSLPDQGLSPITINFSVNGGNFDNLGFGGDSYETVIHEIGHALGLNHPHDGTLFPGVPNGQDQNTGDNGQNQQIYTVMSYAVGWEGEPTTTQEYGTAATPMAFDIAAAQFLYGVRAANTDDTTYVIDTTNDVGTGWVGIWDTAGLDTISASNLTSAVTIDLREAPLVGPNAGGYVSWQGGVKGGFVIANGVAIENAIGGSAADIITGNNLANEITAAGGNDTIDGGAGSDTSVYTGVKSNYEILKSGDVVTIRDNTGTDGFDTLTNVEFAKFSDATVDLTTFVPSTLAGLTSLIDSTTQNLSQFKAISAAYTLLGGVPGIEGYIALINANNASNFGAGVGPVFNDETIYINIANALYQGNPEFKSTIDSSLSSAATLAEKLSLVYDDVIAASARSADGKAFFQSQSEFYLAKAAELGIAGINGAALVAKAALTKIAVDSALAGIGDTINDLLNAVKAGNAAIPATSTTLIPTEDADGTAFDSNDVAVTARLLGPSSEDVEYIYNDGPDANQEILANSTAFTSDLYDTV